MSILTLAPVDVKFSIGRERHGLRAPKGGCTVGGKVYKGGQFCLPYDVANPHGEPDLAPTRTAIHGFVYTVKPIPAGECGSVAFAMHRIDTNHTYHIVRDGFGEVTCSCPDFELRRAGTGQPCKHGRKLIELGLIEAATPLPRRTPPVAPTAIPAPRRRRFEPTPEEMAEAAQIFADVEAERVSYHRELARAL